MKMDELDDDAMMIVHIIGVRMLMPLVENVDVEEKEKAAAITTKAAVIAAPRKKPRICLSAYMTNWGILDPQRVESTHCAAGRRTGLVLYTIDDGELDLGCAHHTYRSHACASHFT